MVLSKTAEQRDRIRELNDVFRTTLTGGRIVLTQGVSTLPRDKFYAVLRGVIQYNDFDKDDDPWGEHDFVGFDIDGVTYFGKIDYYDLQMKYHSKDPADPAKTIRVLTIMEASEY